MIDIARVRRDTPSCSGHIHFLNSGASPSPEPVRLAVERHLRRECEIGGYAAEREAAPALADLYDSLAALLGCAPDEIAYVENATRAWNMAFYALPWQAGDRIVTCTAEYASNYLAFLHMAREKGVVIDVAPDTADGEVDVNALERLITPRTRLIAITHVPTQGGLVNPAAAIGAVARRRGVLYLLDACQSVGQMPIDVGAIGCDFLSGTGRKFLRGPRGTGFLYARRDICARLHPPFVDLHAATWTGRDSYALAPGARRFENWESYVAGRIGLAAAVRYALELGLDDIWARLRFLAELHRRRLAAIPQVVLTDTGREKCGIVTFLKRGEAPAGTLARLTAAGISASVSRMTSARLDFEARGLDAVVRTALHYFNTEEEIERVAEVVAR